MKAKKKGEQHQKKENRIRKNLGNLFDTPFEVLCIFIGKARKVQQLKESARKKAKKEGKTNREKKNAAELKENDVNVKFYVKSQRSCTFFSHSAFNFQAKKSNDGERKGEKVFEEVKRQENKWWQLAKLHQILLKRDAFKIILYGFIPHHQPSTSTFSNHSLIFGNSDYMYICKSIHHFKIIFPRVEGVYNYRW